MANPRLKGVDAWTRVITDLQATIEGLSKEPIRYPMRLQALQNLVRDLQYEWQRDSYED